MQEEITVNNYKSVNIETIALDRNRLGTLVYEKANTYLKKLQEVFIELESLDYPSILTPNEVADIDNAKARFIEYLNRIRTFDINQPDPGGQHDQLEQEVENFYNDTSRQLRPFLTALRQEVTLKSSDQKILQREAKQASDAKKEYENLSKQLTTQIEQLKKQQIKVETGRGKLASTVLAKHFEDEASHFEIEATSWLTNRTLFFISLGAVIGLNLVLYVAAATNFWFLKNIKVEDIFTPHYLGVKVALVALLSYGLAFASKNYRINSGLAFINRHRKSVAQTIEDYLGTNPPREIQDQLIKEGVKAMFEHIHSAYSSKEQGDGSPATEVITNIFKNAGSNNSGT